MEPYNFFQPSWLTNAWTLDEQAEERSAARAARDAQIQAERELLGFQSHLSRSVADSFLTGAYAAAAANYDHAYHDKPSGILLPKGEAIVRTEEEMWRDIESAKESAVAEAKKIVDEAAMEDERLAINTLVETGLTNAKGVQDRIKEMGRKERVSGLAKLIEDYAQVYPVNKFITEETIKTICEKYNLYFTQAKKFIGEIPARCLKEIANFKVRRGDMRYTFKIGQIYNDAEKAEFMPGQSMSVMAPMSELNYSEGYDQLRGHILYDDPIILQPVNGGFLIVTSWGKEAADPLVVNPNHN